MSSSYQNTRGYGNKAKTYLPKDYTFDGVDVSRHMVDLQGKDYLQVAGRVLWFRAVEKTGQIETQLIKLDDKLCMFRAVVYSAAGRVLATAHGTTIPSEFPKGWIEKAESVAIGRALGLAGFGTQFLGADKGGDDSVGKLADAPI